MVKPTYLAMLVCEGLHRDRVTGRYCVLGLTSRVYGSTFPCTHPGLMVFAELANGQGKGRLRLDVVDADDRCDLARVEMECNFDHRFRIFVVRQWFKDIVFPAPGDYRFRLYIDEEHLVERNVTAIHVQEEFLGIIRE